MDNIKLNNSEEQEINDLLGEKYLSYALSTIMSRSLPDVRDGLKPVHRRILYDMMLLKLNPNTPHKKSARVVGDVIGKYHPHGDQAVYDAMVRLAQSFSVRYPLIDGQGNFGSIDGDNAAAMRYTESRLTPIALKLLEDIDEETVAFKDNYDGQETEPSVLPATFPNLLANGSEGIAVGMATSIPPHNLDELCIALIELNKNKNLTNIDLLDYIQGPDFPTGAILIDNKESIINSYTTGRGSFRIRAKWHIEELSHGMYQIIVTEIPYQVQKSKLIEKIAELYREKKLALLGNISDESTDDIRLVIEPKARTNNPEMLMESLFKLTDLEIKYSLNMNILDKHSVPSVLDLKSVLLLFLEHRDEIILNRSKFNLKKIEIRLEILNGLLVAYLNIDEIISIIRENDEPKQTLITRFNLTDTQAEAILNLKLRSLRKLEEMSIKNELADLEKQKNYLIDVLNNETSRKEIINEELKLIKKNFGKNTELGKRRTLIEEAKSTPELSIEALVEKEPIIVICSKLGWIRCIKGHNIVVDDIKYKDGDEERFIISSYTTNKLLLFTEKGKFFTLNCCDLASGKGFGDSIKLILDIHDGDEVVELQEFKDDIKFFIASTSGKGFIVKSEDIYAHTKSGKQVLNVPDDEKALICKELTGELIALIANNRKMLVLKVAEIPEMKKGLGVTLQKFKNAKLTDAKVFKEEKGLSWKMGDKVRTETNLLNWINKRGSAGRIAPFGFPRNNKF